MGGWMDRWMARQKKERGREGGSKRRREEGRKKERKQGRKGNKRKRWNERELGKMLNVFVLCGIQYFPQIHPNSLGLLIVPCAPNTSSCIS